jgi:hypothetical protein
MRNMPSGYDKKMLAHWIKLSKDPESVNDLTMEVIQERISHYKKELAPRQKKEFQDITKMVVVINSKGERL